MNEQRRMRIVLLQSAGFDHLLAARRAVAVRYPGAAFVGLVRAEDMRRAGESGAFDEVRPMPSDDDRPAAGDIMGGPVDLCVVPFESRFGIFHWKFRLLPIRHGVPVVASYNRLGRLREWGRLGWLANSVLVCGGGWPALRVRGLLGRGLAVAALFGLAGSALLLHGVRSVLNGVPARDAIPHAPAARRRLVLFIPSMGVGGTQRQMLSFLKHLDRTMWDPELVMLDVPDKFFEPAVRALGVPIIYLNSRSDFWMSGVVWRLMRHLRAHPCDVLHCWLHYAAALGAIAGRLAGTPVVIGSLRSERPGRFPWFYPKWQRALDVLTAPLHTTIIANSNAVREENRRWAFIPERKLLTIYNGIEADEPGSPDGAQLQRLRSGLKLPADAPLVGIVGRLFPEKDHATFLRAAALVARAKPDTRFLIVGDGVLRGRIESDIERLGLAGRAQVLGERKDARAVIELLDVLVLTSLSEGFPNVLVEAAVAGTPAVTTAAGGAVEVVLDGETGYVVPCGDAEALAGRVLQLLGDPALSTRFAEAARARTRAYFSADRAAEAIQACYVTRPLRVCLISTYAYGLLRPSSGLPVGGAEVQACSLARELARDPRFEVVVLTGDRGRRGREREGALTIVLSGLFGKLQGPASGRHGGMDAGGGTSTAWSACVARVRAWLDRCPAVVADGVRRLVRAGYAARLWLLALCAKPLCWLIDRGREWRECAQWVRQLRALDADVYVMRCASPQVGYVKLACALTRRKLVYMVAHEHEVSGQYARAGGIWGRRFEWGLRHADAIVCQHADQLGMVRDRYGKEGLVIRSLCPTPVRRVEATARRTILWVARLDQWKQPELFIELAGRMPEESFVMVGPPRETDPEGAGLPAGRSIPPNLRVVTRVPFEDTAALFAGAKLFVNTSSSEGFPNTFLQAAACGTPIVSWAVNPDRIFDRYEIGYCAGQDWARFEGCVRLLCADAALRERLGENGRRYVRECHDPAAVVGAFAALLFALRDDSPPAGAGCRPASVRPDARNPVAEALREP